MQEEILTIHLFFYFVYPINHEWIHFAKIDLEFGRTWEGCR